VSNTKNSNPDIEKTRKRVIGDYKKGVKPKELSEKYGVSINTVKSWISRYKRKNAHAEPGAKDAPAPRKPGAPVGNTNAVGNNGGAPIGNTNAFKHGGYSKIFWDTLDEGEKQMLEELDFDGEQLLLDEISLLSVRERRIMASIAKHKAAKGGQVVSGIVRKEDKREFSNDDERALYEEQINAKIDAGERLPGRTYRLTTTTEATYDIIQRLEEALTRCQAQKQRCIDSLNKLRMERGDDGKAAPENNLLQALLSATMEDLDTDDIPELEQTPEHSNDVVE
jgi:uncharacterized protein YjcR